jgi:hypothetical protein
MADYLKELETLQTWIKEATGLGSWRLAEMPPKLARPVIVFESPNRRKDRELGQYSYVMRVQQFGKLYVKSTDHLAEIQEQLFVDLENRYNVLEIEGNFLKAIVLDFEDIDGLDVPFSITYEATYTRIIPEAAPPATFVGTKITTDY